MILSGEDLVPKQADEMEEFQGKRAAGGWGIARADPSQQEQPSSGPERRRRRQAQARPQRRTRHLPSTIADRQRAKNAPGGRH